MFLILKWYHSVKQAQYNMHAFLLLFSLKRKLTKKKKIAKHQASALRAEHFRTVWWKSFYKLI